MTGTIQQVFETIDSFSGSYWASLGIAAVGSYLGLFTILRRIVFTGVALAQLATAGVACAIFVAERPSLPHRVAEFLTRHGPTIGSLGFSFLGMLGLESRVARRHLSSDSLVGLAYAAASALAILLVWRSAVGLVELQNILAGDVLLSDERELLSLWIGLIAVVLLHIIYRRQFILVSYDPDFARAQGFNEQRYQRLLLGSLAVAVALSLKTAGLLLVFAVLVLPALTGLSLGRTLRESGLLAIGAGLCATLSGYSLSIILDWPVAPSISLSLLILLALATSARSLPWLGWPTRIVISVGAATSLVVALLVFSPAGVRRSFVWIEDDHHPAPPTANDTALEDARLALASADLTGRIKAAATLGRLGGPADLSSLLVAHGEAEPESRNAYLNAIADLIEDDEVSSKLGTIASSSEPELAVRASIVLIELGRVEGIVSAVALLSKEEISIMPRFEVVDTLAAISGDDFGYDAFSSPEENTQAIEKWKAWLESATEGIKFDAELGWKTQ